MRQATRQPDDQTTRPPDHQTTRPPDRRPRHDDRRLAEAGIRRYESKRLKLYTDIDPAIAPRLPRFIDGAYEAWNDYFGPLPPGPQGTEYQLTGYIMQDEDAFRRLGLIPDDLRPFVNGRHRGQRFWMYEPEHSYYRRHLMIHEATHCFMTAMPDVVLSDEPGVGAPLWYMEGMAELFGTHRVEDDGTIHFRVMPEDRERFVGWGRIGLLRRAIAGGRYQSLDELKRLKANDYLENEIYAWSWALCAYFDTHPRYRDRFRKLGQHLTGPAFRKAFQRLFGEDLRDIRTEWPLFAHHVRFGYDAERAAIEFRAGKSLERLPSPYEVAIAADHGWQSGEVRVEKGRAYKVTASGRFTLAQEPKPWVSEPPGISFRYFGGRPLGRLLATVRAETVPAGEDDLSMLDVIPVGREKQFTAPRTGTLYFRLNDSWSELADNTGTVTVRVHAAGAGGESR